MTVNDYLARRDARWMGGIYEFLGLSVACIQQNHGHGRPPARLEIRRFLAKYESVIEDQRHGFRSAARPPSPRKYRRSNAW